MAYDKIVDGVQLDTNLTSIANAIRGKNGTSEQIHFPDGFVTAINALENGGTITVNTANLHDTATDIADVYLEHGVETAYTGWTTTDYIPVAANTTYAFQSSTTEIIIKGVYCGKYSADKKYTERFGGGIATINNALMLWKNGTDGYIRLSGNAGAIAGPKVYSCTGTINGILSM